jgi:alpha,alpha-trehalose phosphorylase
LRSQVEAALAEARHTGWDGLVSDQRKFLDDYWERADVVIDGDAELQQAVRFGMFHAVQAGARAERRPIPAKGLTGPGYDGHVFWDTESYVLPLLTYTMPKAAADALRWRHSILDDARQRAAELGLEGAAFPWRTLHGAEASGYWPAGTAAFHIGADIAEAVARYQAAVDDPAFEREVGVEILVEVARLFRSLGHHDSEGRFRIDGVTGPDEYSALADDNAFTNLMAQLALREAARAVEHHGEVAARFGVDLEEAAAWRDAAEAMHLHYDEKLGVHPQAEGFTEHRVWDFENTPQEHYPLLLHYPYFQLYRTQVVKQADLVMALFKRGDAFTPEEKVRNFRYYEAITVRDSSLSACIQSVVAAETGFLNLAYDYLGEAALMDLDDLEHNTRDGLHIASLAGAWIGVVSGFGGMRDHDGKLTFAPRLPAALQHISFRVTFRGSRLLVDITHDHATYQVIDGGPLETAHHGERFTATSKPAKKPIPPIPHVDDPPQQPAGRAPARRRPLRRERAETTG